MYICLFVCLKHLLWVFTFSFIFVLAILILRWTSLIFSLTLFVEPVFTPSLLYSRINSFRNVCLFEAFDMAIQLLSHFMIFN